MFILPPLWLIYALFGFNPFGDYTMQPVPQDRNQRVVQVKNPVRSSEFLQAFR